MTGHAGGRPSVASIISGAAAGGSTGGGGLQEQGTGNRGGTRLGTHVELEEEHAPTLSRRWRRKNLSKESSRLQPGDSASVLVQEGTLAQGA